MLDLGAPPVAIVSLPWSFKDDPFVWGVLAHEVHGHDAVHSIPGLIEEISSAVKAKLPDASWSDTWAAWAEEATADACATLTMGPAYPLALTAWLSACANHDNPGTMPLGRLRTTCTSRAGGLEDDHPVDLLRLYLMIGVLSGMTTLGDTAKAAWIRRLSQIAVDASGGANTVDLVTGNGLVLQSYPLAALTDGARMVGELMVSVPLDHLGGRKLAELDCWNDNSENQVGALSANYQPDGGKHPVPWLLAGAVLAVFNSGDAPTISRLLGQALDVAYQNDVDFAVTVAKLAA